MKTTRAAMQAAAKAHGEGPRSRSREPEQLRRGRQEEDHGQDTGHHGQDNGQGRVGPAHRRGEGGAEPAVDQDQGEDSEDEGQEGGGADLALTGARLVQGQHQARRGAKDQQALDGRPADKRQGEEGRLRRTRRALHDVALVGLRLEDKGADRIDDHLDHRDMQGPQQDRHAGHQGQEGQSGDGDVGRDDEAHGLAQIVPDAPAGPDGAGDGAEVVVEEDEGGRLPGHVRPPAAHGHADVGGAKGRGVIDPVAGHGHHLAPGPQGLHQPQLLLGQDPGADPGRADPLAQTGLVQAFHLLTGEDLAGVDPGLEGDGPGGAGVIAGDHEDAHPRLAALAHGGRDGSAQGIGEADQAPEGEGEVPM